MIAFIIFIFNRPERMLPMMLEPSPMRSLIVPRVRPRAIVRIVMMSKSANGQGKHRQSGYDPQHMLLCHHRRIPPAEQRAHEICR
jgi:hypothetical protein